MADEKPAQGRERTPPMADEKPAQNDDEKPVAGDGSSDTGKTAAGGQRANRAAAKPTTIPMHQPSTGKTWEAQTHAEAADMLMLGWKWDDPAQDTSKVPHGFTGPGKGTPTGGDPTGVTT